MQATLDAFTALILYDSELMGETIEHPTIFSAAFSPDGVLVLMQPWQAIAAVGVAHGADLDAIIEADAAARRFVKEKYGGV